MNFYSALLVLSLAALAAASPASPLDDANAVSGTAPVVRTTGRKIIRLKPGVNQRAFDMQLKSQISKDTSAGPGDNVIAHQYTTGAVKGYAGKFSEAIEQSLKANPMVASIEEDYIGWLEGIQANSPNWGLSRISNRALDLTKPYTYSAKAGEGINVYVIDGGIDTTHEEFEGRATFGVNFIKDEPNTDFREHGTHVAGTIVGKTFGVAKKARVTAIKVCNQLGSCAASDVIAGIQWLIQKEQSQGRKNKAVVNISLGLPASAALDDMVQVAVDAGIAIICSGGNANTDSCLNSPRRAPAAFAVGASAKTDDMAGFSNWGKCIKIFAPGVDIISAKPGGGSQPKSGTSMASPHVAGIAALYLADKEYTNIPQLLKDLVARSSPNLIKKLRNADKTVNLLAYSNLLGN